MGPKRHQPLGPPVTLGATTGPEDFRELAAQEAALAKSAFPGPALRDGCLLHPVGGSHRLTEEC
jgi:hypothetical protein